MGRPLNKRFFSGVNAAGIQIGCTVRIAGANYESTIVSQRSNSKYVVRGVGQTPLAYTSLAFADADPDTITRTGGADFTLAFSAGDSVRIASSEGGGENDGVYEIATVTSTIITLVAGDVLVANADDTTATLSAFLASDVVSATIVDGTPTLNNTMQVTVTPENAVTPVQATVDITVAGGTAGAVLTAVINNPGYGYWVGNGGTFNVDGDAFLEYTVANGSIATVGIFTPGSTAGPDGTFNLGPAPDANPPVQSARIINARQVKTFPAQGGTTYDWPITAPLGAGLTGMTQANLQAPS